MAKTKFKKFVGRIAWAHLYSPDDFRGQESWKISFYPDADVEAQMKAAGLQNKFKDDDGGKSGVAGKFVTLRRPVKKEFNGEETFFSPPEILDKNNKTLVSYKDDGDGDYDRIGEPVLIGNGSTVEVTLEIYQTKRFGAGSRLRSVRIIDLIEYDPDSQEEVEPEVEEEKPAEKSKKKVSW